MILPCQPFVSDTLAKRLQRFKGKALIGPRSGSKTRDFSVPERLPPGPLQELLGFTVVRVESFAPTRNEPVALGNATYDAMLWREELDSDQRALATFAGAFHPGAPALVEKDNFRYLACLASKPLLDKILCDFCVWSGLALSAPLGDLRLRRRGYLQFAFNYGTSPASVPAPADAQFLLGSLRLPAAGVAAWRIR